MSKQKVILATVALLVGFVSTGYAATAPAGKTTSTEVSNRVKNSLGAYLGIGEPSPTLIGLNVAYNVTDFLRVGAGYGSLKFQMGSVEASASTFGFGVRGMMPGWNLTPTVGLHFAHVSYTGDRILDVGGFTESGSHLYGSIGADWQTEGGFNLNAGYRYSFKSGIGGGAYLGAGWFVDWLS